LFNPYNLSATQGINPAKPRRVLEARDRDAYMPHNPVELPLLKVNFPSRSSSRVLILGCGNSLLGEDMLRDGWTGGIVSVDWSQVVIDQMKAKYSPEYLQTIVDDIKIPTGSKKVAECNSDCDTKLMDYVCANVLDGLDFEDGSFDLIVVKGLFDSILSASIPSSNAQKVNEECHRLLKNSHGSLVIVSNGSPENRLVYLEHPGAEWWNGEWRFSVELRTLPVERLTFISLTAIGVHNIPKPRSDRRHILDRDAPK
jgi:SAM-dependent methyltransferase